MAPSFKKDPRFLARERNFGLVALTIGRESQLEPVELNVPAPVPGNATATNRVTVPPCLAELQGIMAVEYAESANDPWANAKALQRSAGFRKAFYQRCAYHGRGRGNSADGAADRPIELTGVDADANQKTKAVEKLFLARASKLLKSDTLKQDCRATLNALFDYNATAGRLYGLEAAPPINADVEQLLGYPNRSGERKNGRAAQIVKRCLLPQPRDEGAGGKQKRKEEVEARPIELRPGLSPKEFDRWMATQGKPLRGRGKKR